MAFQNKAKFFIYLFFPGIKTSNWKFVFEYFHSS